jgi:hypothetical protein
MANANHTLIGYEKKLVFALMFAVLVPAGEVSAAEDVVRYRGDAFDLGTGAFVYSENHSEFYKMGVHAYSRVSYRDKDGKEFASKLITFQPNRLQPVYELKDARDGYVEGIRRSGSTTVYFSRRKTTEAMKEKTVQTPAPAVFDGGFDYFVRENFEEICAGKNKSFFFAVPIELDYFRFRVARQELGDQCRLNLEIDNVVVRQFVKPIKLWYNPVDKRLRKYEGISNINGPDGKSLKVRVVFTYPKK